MANKLIYIEGRSILRNVLIRFITIDHVTVAENWLIPSNYCEARKCCCFLDFLSCCTCCDVNRHSDIFFVRNWMSGLCGGISIVKLLEYLAAFCWSYDGSLTLPLLSPVPDLEILLEVNLNFQDLEILLEVNLNFQVPHNNTSLWYFFPERTAREVQCWNITAVTHLS